MDTFTLRSGASAQEVRELWSFAGNAPTVRLEELGGVVKHFGRSEFDRLDPAVWVTNKTTKISFGEVRGGRFLTNQLDTTEMKKQAAKTTPKAPEATTVTNGPSPLTQGIDKLLKGGKHTVGEAATILHEQNPTEAIDKIKRKCHLRAKILRKRGQQVAWKPSGAPGGTGYMTEIDRLLREEKLTTRQVAETVAEKFNKDLVSAKKVVRARLGRLRRNGETITPPLESAIRPAKAEKPEKAAKPDKPAKAEAKSAKAPAKKATTKAPAKKSAKVKIK